MASHRVRTHNLFVGLSNAVFAVFEVLLVLRFAFKLVAANSQVPFIVWLYQTSDVLVSPFTGIFRSPIFIDRQFELDVTALMALVIYALVFSFINYLFDLAFGIERDEF